MAINRDGDGPPLRREDAPSPSKSDDGLRASPFTEDVFDDEYYGRRRKGGGISFAAIAGVVFVAAAMAVTGWYAMGSRDDRIEVEGSAEVIRADANPYKIKPEEPGGLQVENQDKLIYDRVAKGAPPKRVENLLPEPETPKAPPVKAKEPPKPAAEKPEPEPAKPEPAKEVAKEEAKEETTPPAGDQMAELLAKMATDPKTPAAPPPAQTAAATAAKPEHQPEPQPDAVPAKDPMAELAAKLKAEAAAASAKTGDPPASTGAPTLLVPAADPAADQPEAPAPKQVASAPPPAATAPMSAAPGAMSVQLLSVPSEEAANSEWKRISGKNADILGGQPHYIAQAQVAGKTYYRVRVGPLADKAAADALCAQLAAREVDCIPARP